MKKSLFIILFYSSLFSQEIIFPENKYDLSYNYELFKNQDELKRNKDEKLEFNIKLDFKYKTFQTNNIYINDFKEEKPINTKTTDLIDFEITGFYFEFKTLF